MISQDSDDPLQPWLRTRTPNSTFAIAALLRPWPLTKHWSVNSPPYHSYGLN